MLRADNMLRAGNCSRVNTMPRRVLYIASYHLKFLGWDLAVWPAGAAAYLFNLMSP